MGHESLFLKIIKNGVILLLFTPLVLGPFGLTFSAYPKAVFFRSIVEIVFIFYLFLVLINPSHLPRKTIILFLLLLFLFALFLSSLFGISFQRSFFGDLYRAEGVILQLHLFLFFLVLVGVFRTKKEWFFLLKLTFIISAISSFAGILQRFQVFSFYGKTGFSNPNIVHRISGTLGNPAFFGSYIALSIFLGILLLLVEKKASWKIFLVGIIIFNFFTLLLSGTRGALFAVFVGFIFLFSFGYLKLKQKTRKRILFAVLIFLIFVLVGFLNPLQFNLTEKKLLQRFFNALNPEGFISRFKIWEISFRAWKERPFLGWGPECFSFIYDRYSTADTLRYISPDIYIDYAHNKFFELLACTGLFGVISYFSIFIFLFYFLFKKKKISQKEISGEKNVWVSLVLISFFVSYFIQGLFVFDTISVYLLFFLVLGFVNNNFDVPSFTLPIKKFKERDRRREILNILKKVSACFLIFLFLIIFVEVNLKPTIASISFPRFAKYEIKNPQKAILGYKKATEKNTIYDKDLRFAFMERLIYLLETGRAKNAEGEIIKVLYQNKPLLEKDLENLDRRPVDSYEILARINERIYLFSKDKKALEEMEETLKKIYEFNKNKPEFYRLMGELEILRGNYKKGENLFQKLLYFGYNEVDVWRELGAVYIFKVGDKAKGGEYLKKVLEKEYYSQKFNSTSVISSERNKAVSFTETVAILYYRDLNDFDTCRQIYERAMEIYPEKKEILQMHLKELIKKSEIKK